VDGHVDLLLSGDTHGGQIALPLIGPLIKVRRWRDRFYEAGLHTAPGGTRYYVNRGIGMEGHHVPRVRFNVPPEVTLLEIRPE
jgi:predicted MPP superfamily phosphohydrolase